jgi:NAD-dependent dihydropyrimidine dehydrogenase PreA subunit
MNRINRQILFCNCQGERIGTDKLKEIRGYLAKLPFRVTILSDMCGLAGMKNEQLKGLFIEPEEKLLIGCYPRTMKLLLEQVNSPGKDGGSVSFLNMITSTTGELTEAVTRFCDNITENGTLREIKEGSGWPAWFPVIDYARCTACGQCAGFCLFGVYEKTDERINVINPEGCKNQCPACARICPSTAIIFPKYKNGGAIGGSEEIDEKAELQRQAQDIESLLGNDFYQALEERKMKRQSIIREEAMKKALTEREDFLKQNHKG